MHTPWWCDARLLWKCIRLIHSFVNTSESVCNRFLRPGSLIGLVCYGLRFSLLRMLGNACLCLLLLSVCLALLHTHRAYVRVSTRQKSFNVISCMWPHGDRLARVPHGSGRPCTGIVGYGLFAQRYLCSAIQDYFMPDSSSIRQCGRRQRGFALQSSLHFRLKQCCLRKKRCPGKCPPQAAFGPPKGKRRSRCGKHARGGTPRTRRIRDAPSRTARIRWSPCERGIKSQPPNQR